MTTIYIGYISLYGGGINKLYSEETEDYPYKIEDLEMSETVLPRCKQTNEACISCLCKMGIVVDKIIALATPDVLGKGGESKYGTLEKNTFTYFKEQAQNTFSKLTENDSIELIDVPASGSVAKIFGGISTRIYNIIQKYNADDTNIILDFSGGKRDVVVFLQLLMKLLEFNGYNVASYYADLDYTKKTGYFYSCKPIYDQMKILDAVNLFVTTGNSKQFKDYFKNQNDVPKEVTALISTMEVFNNDILLCSLTNLEQHILNIYNAVGELQRYINNAENTSKDINIETLNIVVQQINDKFNLAENVRNKNGQIKVKFSTKKIIEWCLRNGLYQQALTIYTDCMPEYIIKNKLSGSGKPENREDCTKLISSIFEDNQPLSPRDNEAIQKSISVRNGDLIFNPRALNRRQQYWYETIKKFICELKHKTSIKGIRGSLNPISNISDFEKYILSNIQCQLEEKINSNPSIKFNDAIKQITFIDEKWVKGYDQRFSYYETAKFMIESRILIEPIFNGKQLRFGKDKETIIDFEGNQIPRIYKLLYDYAVIKQLRNGTNHALESSFTLDKLNEMILDAINNIYNTQ